MWQRCKRRRLALVGTLSACGCVLSSLIAPPAFAEARVVTLIGINGNMTSTVRYESQVSPDAGETPKDECLVVNATSTYQYRMIGKRPVFEVDYGTRTAAITGADFRLLPGQPEPRVIVTATSSGTARATPGEQSAYVNCSLESPGFVNDDDVTSLTGISPSLCEPRQFVYKMGPTGRLIGMAPENEGAEDSLGRCGWVLASDAFPISILQARANVKAKRVFFEEGHKGTTVALTYNFSRQTDDYKCDIFGPGPDMDLLVCTQAQRGTVTFRFRLGS